METQTTENPFPEPEAAPQPVTTPEPAPEPVQETKPEASEPAPATPAPEPAPVEAGSPEPATTDGASQKEAPKEFFDLLNSELGEIDDEDELKLEGFYSQLNERTIRDLPTPAKQIIHSLRKAAAIERQKMKGQLTERQKEFEAKEQQLKLRERDLLRKQEEFAAIVNDPKVLDAAKTPEGELPDPYTEEGIQARIQKGVAEAFQGFLQPFQQSATERRQESAWLDFVEQNPEARDSGFQKEMISLIKQRASEGQRISTQDAFRIVKLERIEKENNRRKAMEATARSQSARRVARTTTPGSSEPTEIPADVKKNPVKLAAWLKDHPDAWRKIDSMR